MIPLFFFFLCIIMCAEHFAPLLEQIAKLDEALYNIQFEQHWLEAQTDRQAICKFIHFFCPLGVCYYRAYAHKTLLPVVSD